MKILLSPQVSENKNFKYTFEGDIVTVTLGDITDTFDFTGLPDGVMQKYDEEGNEFIETKLEINPLIRAEKRDGVLYLELLNRIGINASEEERFPDWIDVKDYVFKENPDNIKEGEDGENSLEEPEGN